MTKALQEAMERQRQERVRDVERLEQEAKRRPPATEKALPSSLPPDRQEAAAAHRDTVRG
jgi:hypothetical protein